MRKQPRPTQTRNSGRAEHCWIAGCHGGGASCRHLWRISSAGRHLRRMNKDLQNEIDALVKLGQTGVHTVTRSQAFKDTGWDPTEAYLDAMAHQWILVSLNDDGSEEYLTDNWSSDEILTKSPEEELETLECWIRDNATENEYSYPSCLIESLRSSEGQDCGLFIEFYRSVWDHPGTVDDCRWVVFPSREELDLLFLRKNQFLYPANDRLNKDLLGKWNEENRDFWKKIYEYHEKWSLGG